MEGQLWHHSRTLKKSKKKKKKKKEKRSDLPVQREGAQRVGLNLPIYECLLKCVIFTDCWLFIFKVERV